MNEDEYKVNLKDEVNQKDLVEKINPCEGCQIWEDYKDPKHDKYPRPLRGVSQCEFCPDRSNRRQ